MNGTGRLEAFSDGVLAVIITIMVLKISAPDEASWAALRSVLPAFLSYILSFIYVGIYWNNHHHMFKVAQKVNGSILWANLHLLFWLSLVPFATGWMGATNFAPLPTALYGVMLFLSAVAWMILQQAILAAQEESSLLAQAVKGTFKEKISPILYIAGIAFSFYEPWVAWVIYFVVALIWFVPDRRIERVIEEKQQQL